MSFGSCGITQKREISDLANGKYYQFGFYDSLGPDWASKGNNILVAGSAHYCGKEEGANEDC